MAVSDLIVTIVMAKFQAIDTKDRLYYKFLGRYDDNFNEGYICLLSENISHLMNTKLASSNDEEVNKYPKTAVEAMRVP